MWGSCREKPFLVGATQRTNLLVRKSSQIILVIVCLHQTYFCGCILGFIVAEELLPLTHFGEKPN